MNKQSNTVHEHKIDPRILRTRRLLLDGFNELLLEQKIIRKITIADISERAGVNRVTFYAHFKDKYSLLYEWKRDLFKQILDSKISNKQKSDNAFMENVIDAVIEGVTLYNLYRRRVNEEYEPLFESAMQEELTSTLQRAVNQDAITSIVQFKFGVIFLSWAIFGSANEWSKSKSELSKEDFKKQLMININKLM